MEKAQQACESAPQIGHSLATPDYLRSIPGTQVVGTNSRKLFSDLHMYALM